MLLPVRELSSVCCGWLMEAIGNDSELRLQVIATGMHLSPEFGSTYEEIEEAGYVIDAKVEMLIGSDSSVAVTKSMGLGMIGFADAYKNLAPDILVVLGDRFEIFAAAASAMIAGIPIAHIHGGETTEGAFDEAIRHSITKMAHLHFVAADEYRRRVIQLGEHPDVVFNVGGMGIDAIERTSLLSREELESSLGLKFAKKNLLITFHPVTLECVSSSASQFKELLLALDELTDTVLIFTLPNADTGGRALGVIVEEFVEARPNAFLFKSLGQRRYFSCLKHVDAVVGNSSSGLIEAPSFGIGTINIGDRQLGRLKSRSVIDCLPDRCSIREGLSELYSQAFQAKLKGVDNLYGNGGAANAIVDVLSNYPMQNILKKSFYDQPIEDLV